MFAQVALIQRLAKQRGWSSLEALTIDRCQGRDKDVILVSMVRSLCCPMSGKGSFCSRAPLAVCVSSIEPGALRNSPCPLTEPVQHK